MKDELFLTLEADMFFILSKLLAFLVSPLVWVFVFFIISLFTARTVLARRLRITGLVVLYLCSNSFLVDECFRAWEPVTADHDKLDTRYDGAIILGGLGDIDLRLGKINFGASGDRLFQALPLFHQGRFGRIIFTGGSGSIEFPEKREALFVKKYLNSIGIADSSLLIESESRNTYENAVFTRRIFDSLNLQGRYLLITSAYHMPRSLAVFKKAGFSNLEPYITNKSSGLRRYTFDHLLIPNPGALWAFHTLVHEWAGFVIYKVKGYA